MDLREPVWDFDGPDHAQPKLAQEIQGSIGLGSIFGEKLLSSSVAGPADASGS